MEILFNLTHKQLCCAEVDEIIVLPDRVSLILTSNVYKDLTLKVFAKCNGKITTYNVSNDIAFDITNILQAGTLELCIHALVKGEIVKTWQSSPIIVKEIAGKFELKDLLSDIEARVVALEDQHKPIL